MISFIICSVNPLLYKQVTDNIDETIGIPHEIILFDNRNNNIGICSAYNQCARGAKYDYLCFLHEDVIFHSKDWGKMVIESFSDISVGLVGLSGATYRPRVPVAWSQIPGEFYRISIPCIKSSAGSEVFNPFEEIVSKAAIIDGFFMVTKKEIWEKIRFNELLSGFHFYDMDYSLSVGNNYKILVRHDIKAEHFSVGNFNNSWYEASKVFYLLWKKKLPRSTYHLSFFKRIKVEQYAAISYVFTSIKLSRPLKEFFKFWIMALFLNPFCIDNYKTVYFYYLQIIKGNKLSGTSKESFYN